MHQQKIDLLKLANELTPAVRNAGNAIMRIHRQAPNPEFKKDGSPVTEADELAEQIVLAAIAKFAPGIPIVSEENTASHSTNVGERFFLVDALDGTREFVKFDGSGHFTVNIALIENGQPILGIVYAPALDRMFEGIAGVWAKEDGSEISIRKSDPDCLTALASLSHREQETDAWLSKRKISETVAIGSSLKFCMIAAGEADIYPRFGPTMEWDTAAGHAVLIAAGGCVESPDGSEFTYGKNAYKNGPFIAHAGCI